MQMFFTEEEDHLREWVIMKMADIDLLKSLEIRPDDPYSLNYLAYSWLERKFKIRRSNSNVGKSL